MPMKKLVLKPGVNREVTRYANEGGWYETDKVRFNAGFPENIGGWRRISESFFLGICRALYTWSTLVGVIHTAVGTNLKYYIELGGTYYDITPLRDTEALTDPFETTVGSPIVEVTDAAEGFISGDFVTFSGATAVGGLTIDGEYQITLVTASTYTITASSNATSSATGGGSVTAAYQINTGPAESVPLEGWGAGGWGSGGWGEGETSVEELRLWSQANFGEDLVFGPRGGGLYYWDASAGLTTRAVNVVDMGGASEVPVKQNFVLVSDISRFVFCFGVNDIGSSTIDPMLIRWSDQEDVTEWNPQAVNQAGSLRLSRGSKIVSAVISREEVLVWTDAALYSLQFVGAPDVWVGKLVGENISIASPRAAAYSNGVAYWMGRDKFYLYDGRSQPLESSLQTFVFNRASKDNKSIEIFSGNNEKHHEIWWFYASSGQSNVDSYVIYNYVERVWYYGSLQRTAWHASGLSDYPIAATYSNNLVNHELGTDNEETGTPASISATITSSPVDIDDGDRFSFIRKLLPDVKFDGSETDDPTITITLLPLKGSGAGYTSPASSGGVNTGTVMRSQTSPISQYTDKVFTRLRGRQIVLKIESNQLGCAWQWGAPQIDIRPDGRQ